ncbi:MAG: PaaI family thioesterase [Rhodothalassiaceae bacterium]
MPEPVQERRYTWQDPAAIAAKARQLSGQAFFDQMISTGSRPPIADTFDFDLIGVEDGVLHWRGRPGPWAMNPIGTVHGGYAATILDSAMGCAVHLSLDQGEAYTTVDLSVKYLRPLMPDTQISATGRLVHRGRSLAVAEAELFDHRGKRAAHATTSCMIFRPDQKSQA